MKDLSLREVVLSWDLNQNILELSFLTTILKCFPSGILLVGERGFIQEDALCLGDA